MEYPDRWVLVDWGDGELAVLCGWGGGFTQGQSWKRSSPIQKFEQNETEYIFTTASGNQYVCPKCAIGYTSLSFSIAAKISDNAINIISDEDKVHETLALLLVR